MGGLRRLMKSPAGVALVVVVVFGIAYLIGRFLAPGLLGGRGEQEPTTVTAPQQPAGSVGSTTPLPPAPSTSSGVPGKSATPTPSAGSPGTSATPPAVTSAQAPKPTPSPAAGGKPAPKPAANVAVSSAVPPGPTGRPDPFIPLVRPAGGGAPVPSGPPLVTLPPPPLPGVGAIPPVPGTPPSPTGIQVTGIIGDTSSVAVIVIDGRTQVVGEGDSIGSLRVVKIDASRRLVRFSRGGTQFDVRMGGE